jgi:hypothetical protein
LTFEPRYNVPRIGRVKVAHGADAVDGAFATIYGEAKLTYYEVWAYQINPAQVSVGDSLDSSRRLDGSSTVRFSIGPDGGGGTPHCERQLQRRILPSTGMSIPQARSGGDG